MQRGGYLRHEFGLLQFIWNLTMHCIPLRFTVLQTNFVLSVIRHSAYALGVLYQKPFNALNITLVFAFLLRWFAPELTIAFAFLKLLLTFNLGNHILIFFCHSLNLGILPLSICSFYCLYTLMTVDQDVFYFDAFFWGAHLAHALGLLDCLRFWRLVSFEIFTVVFF
jgi:hypothetical protein